MPRPPLEQVRQRRAALEERLRLVQPIWRSRTAELFRGNDGFFIIRHRLNDQIYYIGITPAGEVRDMLGYDLDGGDIQIAVSSLESAGQTAMRDRVTSWPHRQR